MDIAIKKLTPELLDDYLYFFDNVAFCDHEEWSLCYCMFFHMTDEMEAEYKEIGEVKNREYSIKYITEGRLNGYLAYNDEKVVGWLNVDDKSAYNVLSKVKSPELWDDETAGRTKSVTCFLIAPEMRGKGIATRLLERALFDAAAEGYDFAEAYPVKNEGDCFLHYHGPKGLYEKFGFELYKDFDKKYILRKRLRQRS